MLCQPFSKAQPIIRQSYQKQEKKTTKSCKRGKTSGRTRQVSKRQIGSEQTQKNGICGLISALRVSFTTSTVAKDSEMI
jgi:hypothetical protein